MVQKKIIVVFFVMIFLINLVYAERLSIEMRDSYFPGEEVQFKVYLYDDLNEKIEGEIDYVIQDYYSEVFTKGKINSGEETSFVLPQSVFEGWKIDAGSIWGISVKSGDAEMKQLFKIKELEKAEIKLEGDYLIIENKGNVIYNEDLILSIGDVDQIINVHLEVGQNKKRRLTALDDIYDIKVIEGNQEPVVFEGVSLTGNVVGLEEILEGSFLEKYPMVGLFLTAVGLVAMVVLGLKIKERFWK